MVSLAVGNALDGRPTLSERGDFTAQQIAEFTSAAMHSSDHCSQAMGMQITEIGPGHATVEMRVRQDYVNGQGYCHGGIITCVADTAFAQACNSYNRQTVAQGLSVEFVGSAMVDDVLLAVALEQSRAKRTGVYQVMVYKSCGKLIAIFTGKSFERGGRIW